MTRTRPTRPTVLPLLGLAMALAVAPRVFAQELPAPTYESRFVHANGVRLQYMDFGGSGLPLIFVQDIHNYFEDEDPYFRDVWSAFYARFTDRHRVLATVRRGYGESDAPEWGYDIATQSEDVLGLMDALGIERAVLFGRVPATQDLTWIAEHHPERVAGLVYRGNPLVNDLPENPDALAFSEHYSSASCDLEQRADALVTPRLSWRPHFLSDSTASIQVPAIRFTDPAFDRTSMSLRRLDRVEASLAEIDVATADCAGEADYLEFVIEVARDPERWAALRRAFETSGNSVAVDDAFVRAFGSSMESILEPAGLDGWSAAHDFMFPHMRRFLDRLTAGGP